MKSVGYRVKAVAGALDEAGWAAAKPVFEFRGPLACSGPRRALPAVGAKASGRQLSAVRADRMVRPQRQRNGRSRPRSSGPDRGQDPTLRPEPPGDHTDGFRGTSGVGWRAGQPGRRPRRQRQLDRRYRRQPAGATSRVRFADGVLCHQSGRRRFEETACPAGQYCRHAQHTCLVEAVGYSAVAPPRDERPRDLPVFTSPHSIGEHWELQKELHDIAGGAYEEIRFDGPVRAKRVKFVIPRVWNTRVDGSRLAGGYMAEVYVYGTGLAGNLPFTLETDATISASIHNREGDLVRTLWQLRPMTAGRHLENGTASPTRAPRPRRVAMSCGW